ncbi:MAG: hypothetical protein QOG68_1601 [Solirubrobacteraceae bacterium]|nr:hypothetical protein [Solirubrobacteraceae bacterium]
MPLDRTGAVPGKLSLRYATESGVRAKKHVLLALTGGPGQPGVPFGPSFASELAPVLSDHSLVVVDQRGTGGSYGLSCPEVQGIDGLSAVFPGDVGGCADRIGPAINSFASIETAADIEAVREKLGVDKIALYGVSYGTWVEQQYARLYPTHVERLVLDSVVAPVDDPYDLRTYQLLPRVLRGLCAGGACDGITTDPVADLDAVVRRIQTGGQLRGTIRNASGGRERAALSQSDLVSIIIASDLNSYMQARVPAALVAGRRGDPLPLLRLKHDTAGATSPLDQFSAGLFVATTCLDNDLPYGYGDPGDVRATKAAAALAQVPDSAFAPFDRQTVNVSSLPQFCLQWPDGSFRHESTAPMPDVPTLMLSGTADFRTPTENAQLLATEIPHAQIVTLHGSGHDVGGVDTTGCFEAALRRFFADRPVGTPCKGHSVAPRLALTPPQSLGAVAALPGVPGLRGKVLRAAVDTLLDTADSDNESYYAGFTDTSGGGLRGGFFESHATGAGQLLTLHRIQYVPRVALSGKMLIDAQLVIGGVRVSAPDGLSGRVLLLGASVVGRLGGRVVHTTLGRLQRTRLTPAARRVGVVSRIRMP